MNSYPSAEDVFAELGDKVLTGLSAAVAATRTDLATHRSENPGWAATQSVRGLANLIHDRLWYHLTVHLDPVPEVTIVDDDPGPRREFWVGTRYRFRAKRHRAEDGRISTYLTAAALEFLEQTQQALPGLEVVNLAAGYEWDADTREIGAAVLSLRSGRDKVIWCEKLLPPGSTGEGGPVGLPPLPKPTPPTISVDSEGVADRDQEAGST